MKKKRIKYGNIAIVLVGLAVVILLVIGIKNVFNTKPNDKPKPNEEISRMKMDIMDYDFYNTKDFNFNFAVVKIRISDKEAINYELGSIYTDEKIRLSDYEKYQNELEEAYYYLGSQNISSELISDKKIDTFNLFAPIKDKSKRSLTLYDGNSKSEFTLDLNKNQADIESLKYHTGNEIDFNSNKMLIKDAYVANGFYKDGEEYTYPAVVNIYAFILEVKELSEEGIKIEEAYLQLDGTKEKIQALDASFTNMKVNNIIGRELYSEDKAALFFETNIEPNELNGTLKIKFSNSDEYLSLETEIKE